jgi:hypothetical protein
MSSAVQRGVARSTGVAPRRAFSGARSLGKEEIEAPGEVDLAPSPGNAIPASGKRLPGITRWLLTFLSYAYDFGVLT